MGVPPRARQSAGLACLGGVVFLWITSSLFIQWLFNNQDYQHPFVLTYFNTACFSLYLLGFLFMPSWTLFPEQTENPIRRWVINLLTGRWDRLFKKPVAQFQPLGSDDEETLPRPMLHSDTVAAAAAAATTAPEAEHPRPPPLAAQRPPEEAKYEKLNVYQVIRLAAIFCPFWFLANYTFNASLSMTSASSVTILSSTAGLWTLFFGVVLHIDNLSPAKVLATVVSFSGVVMVSWQDTSAAGDRPLFGDLLALLSAVFYAVYILVLKIGVKHEDRLHPPMLFGFVGLLNLACLWPVGVLLDVLDIEQFQMPTGKIFLYLFLGSIFGTVLSDLLWLWAVLLTTPLVCTLGLSLQIPISILANYAVAPLLDLGAAARPHLTALYFVGSFLVLAGFLVVNLDDYIRTPAPLVRWWRRNFPRPPPAPAPAAAASADVRH